MLYSLADVPAPTVEQLRKLAAVAKGKGPLTAVPAAAAGTLPLWFESQPPPESYTDENGQVVFKGKQTAQLKQAVLSIFTSNAAVNVEHLLLYASASTLPEAADRAIKVLGNADGKVDRDSLLSLLSLGSLSCFEDASVRASDVELVEAALGAGEGGAGEGKEAGQAVTVADLMLVEKGLVLVSSCQGLEAKAPYTMLSKL